MNIYGTDLSVKELRRRTGNLNQIAGIQKQRVIGGPDDGIEQYRVRTGNFLEYTVLADRCMDIGDVIYRGINISYIAKPGLIASSRNAMHQRDFLRNFNAGMLYTCGLSNVGIECTDMMGEFHPQHGRIAYMRAENAYAKQKELDDTINFEIGGSSREAELFGRNLILHRKISSEIGSRKILIKDIVENQTVESYTIMLLYHFNFGYPFASEYTKIYFEDADIRMRDSQDKEAINKSTELCMPIDGQVEQVFIRKFKHETNENIVRIENTKLGIGVILTYKIKNLPFLIEWKSMASGDYVLAIEPSNCEVMGRNEDIKHGNGSCIGPFGKEYFELSLEFFDI